MGSDSLPSIPCQRDAQWKCSLAPDGDFYPRVNHSMVGTGLLLVDSDDKTMVTSEEEMIVVRAET